jgi:drug/metabolite transporter (DMT)-like permease
VSIEQQGWVDDAPLVVQPAAPVPAAPSSPAPPSKAGLIAGLLVLWIGWGSVYAAMSTSAETIPPLLATGIRFILAGSVLGALGGARRVNRELATRREWRSAATLGFLCILIGTGGIVVAVRHVASGTVALLAATAPMWVALVEWVWLRRPVRLPTGVGLLVGFAGAGLLATQTGSSAVNVQWAVIVVLCSGAWGLGMVYASVVPQVPSTGIATGLQMVLGGVMVLVLATTVGELGSFDAGAITARSAIGWVWMLLVGALAGYGVCMWLLRVTSPTLVATASYVNPIVAVLVGWALLGEPITTRSIVSGALVLGSVVVIVTHPPGAGS